ncbi:MAG: RNA polymerase sigma factor [Dehalogenimonas sp.]
MEEALVVEKIRRGNADAFACVVEEFQQPIIRYLYRLTSNLPLAQDLAQDTFVDAYKNIMKTRSDLKLKAWLYKIATNNARQSFRRNKNRQVQPIPDEDCPELATDDRSPLTDLNIDVSDALVRVPLEQRECLVLHFVEGLNYGDIGATLGISEDAVRMRVARGKQSFLSFYQGGDRL